MKPILICICLVFTSIVVSQESNQKEDNFDLIDLIVIGGDSYRFRIKSKDKTFDLKICLNNDCNSANEYIKSFDSDSFLDGVIYQINTQHSKTLTKAGVSARGEDKLIKKILDKVKSYDDIIITEKLSERDKVFNNTQNTEDDHSGLLSLHNIVDNFMYEKPNKLNVNIYYEQLYDDQYNLKNPVDYPNCKIRLIDATLIFFNNKASTVSVNAQLLDANNKLIEDLEFYNYRYSIPMRAFTYYDNASSLVKARYVLEAHTKTGYTIKIHANDLFDYKSYGNGKIGNFGFSIANQRLHVSNVNDNSNPTKVIQRRFFDFFTGVIYSDVLGVNTESSNSVANGQASILMPMNLGNWQETTALRQFRLEFNVALSNSFEDETRFIGFKDTDKINHFDLYRKNNLNGNLAIDLVSYESKGWFLTTSIGYNLGFYRTGYQYTNTNDSGEDEVINGQLLSITNGPYINFEFRPQENFGADIILSLNEMNLNDDDVINDMNISDDLLENDKSNPFLFKHNIVNVSAKFYWLLNPSKSNGGIYANAGLAYHTPTQSSFPQLQVGYATNLTSFVNRFKLKDKPKKTTTN